MKKNKFSLLGIIVLLVATVFSGTFTQVAEASEDATVLRLAHQAPSGTLYDNLAVMFKDYVEERTDGRYVIEIYSGGSLGGDRAILEGMQVGNIDLAVTTASDVGMFIPEMEVQDLPYLFTTWDEVYTFLDSDVAQDFYDLSMEANFYTFAFMPRGFRHVTNNDGPIETPEDLNGMKIRVAESSIYVDTFDALGANSQAMAWGEVYTALQQGTIDGHENTIVTINDYRIQEVQDYLSKTYHMFGFAGIHASPMFFDSISEEDQEIFRQAAHDAAIEMGGVTQREEEEIEQALIDGGMQINELDIQPFIDLMDPVYEGYFESHSRDWFDAIREVVGQ